MYVSVAVDAFTDDVLHIAIVPHVGTASAQAFLLALKAKGDQVIVTDVNQVPSQALPNDRVIIAPDQGVARCALHQARSSVQRCPGVVISRPF